MARYDGVLFDLLSALLDSWSLWNAVAGSEQKGLEWRKALLRRIYAAPTYLPYEDVVADAPADVGLPQQCAREVLRRWDELKPWPAAKEVLAELVRHVPLAVATNCSDELGRRAAALIGVPFKAVATAERAGFYKPDPRIYRLGLAGLELPPDRVLFVAGSPGDVGGATAIGFRVFWHNPLGLPLPEGSPSPAVTVSTLRPLLDEVLG